MHETSWDVQLGGATANHDSRVPIAAGDFLTALGVRWPGTALARAPDNNGARSTKTLSS